VYAVSGVKPDIVVPVDGQVTVFTSESSELSLILYSIAPACVGAVQARSIELLVGLLATTFEGALSALGNGVAVPPLSILMLI